MGREDGGEVFEGDTGVKTQDARHKAQGKRRKEKGVKALGHDGVKAGRREARRRRRD